MMLRAVQVNHTSKDASFVAPCFYSAKKRMNHVTFADIAALAVSVLLSFAICILHILDIISTIGILCPIVVLLLETSKLWEKQSLTKSL